MCREGTGSIHYKPCSSRLYSCDGGITLAISPAMKDLGVKNRCRVFEIPKGIEYITAMPRMKKYMDYSAEIYATYLKYINQSGRNYRNLNITQVLYI